MTDEERQRAMDFIVEQSAKFSAEIQQLNESYRKAEHRFDRDERILKLMIKAGRRARQHMREQDERWERRYAELVELGELTLDSSVANYLLEFDRPDKNPITIRQLLTHTSGLPAWRPLYIIASGEKGAAMAAIANQPLAYKPGERVVYSDLGFIVL